MNKYKVMDRIEELELALEATTNKSIILMTMKTLELNRKLLKYLTH